MIIKEFSTVDQNEDRQMEALKEEGCEKIYLDKLSGKDTNRPALKEMFSFIREGDIVLVTEFSKFSRSTRDLLDLVQQLFDKKVEFRSIKENVDTTTSSGKLVLTIFAGLAEFERNIILERQAEGIAITKMKGKQMGRKKAVVDEKKFIELYNGWKKGYYMQKKIMDECKISRSTMNKFIRQFKAEGKIQ